MSDYQDLYSKILRGCPECPWKDRKTCTVPPTGPEDSPLMFVGRNPGRHEDRQGLPFVGPAGAALDQFLADSGIQREQAYITNFAKCHGGACDPCPDDHVYDTCEPFLEQEIKLVNPKLIIPLGLDAYRRLTGDLDSIMALQGKIQEFRHLRGQRFFPLTHPSFWIRSPGYYDHEIKPKIIPLFVQTLKNLKIFDAKCESLRSQA